MSKLSIIFYLILVWIPFIVTGQDIDYNSRNIVVNTPDSTIKTKVIVKTDKLKTNSEYVYYWYYGGAINHNLGGFSGKILHGKYEVFDNQQRLKTQGNFNYGLMVGTWNKWFPNGNINQMLYYKNGQLDGKAKVYNEQGKLTNVFNYNHGKLDGKSYFFFRDTTIVKMYRDGIEMGKKKKEPRKSKTKSILKNDGKKKNGAEIKEKESNQQLALQSTPQKISKSIEKPKRKWWQFSFFKKKKEKQEVKK
jgi:hypothetical protein